MKLNPLDDRIVVRQLSAEEKTPGGIVIPDKAKDKPHRGKVVAVGPGKLSESGSRTDIGVKVGDEIVFSPYGCTPIEVDNEELLVMKVGDVLAIVEA